VRQTPLSFGRCRGDAREAWSHGDTSWQAYEALKANSTPRSARRGRPGLLADLNLRRREPEAIPDARWTQASSWKDQLREEETITNSFLAPEASGMAREGGLYNEDNTTRGGARF
jgi:hypothetical protein